MKVDLSVLIAARNEEFIGRTIDGLIANARGDIEVITVLDGAWPSTAIEQHDRVTVLYVPESIGQRAAINRAASLASGEFVMKLDAHCAVSEGFDVELVTAGRTLGETVTQIPRMFNLHAFDWVCEACDWRQYQGPKPERCAKCGVDAVVREMVWQPKRRPVTDFARFDQHLHFQYWHYNGEDEITGAYKGFTKRDESKSEYADVMSSIGACFVMSRRQFQRLGGLDELHGSWGQFGTEIACKSWLSGGRQVVNKKAWFAHLFRTQHGFKFPYPISAKDVEKARAYSRHLWIDGQWRQAERPLSWMLDKFWPVPGWTDEARQALDAPRVSVSSRRAGIVYYSDGHCRSEIREAVCRRLLSIGLPIVSVTLSPLEFGTNIVLPEERGYLTMFRQILAGLRVIDTDVVFFAEHDVLYDPSHFEFVPPRDDTYYYNLNVWKVDADTGRALHYETKQTSGLCASRDLLLRHYEERVRRVEAYGFSRRMGFEPGSHGRSERVDDYPSDSWMSALPNVDIRHGQNLTPSRWRKDQFRDQRHCRGWVESEDVPGIGRSCGRFDEWLSEVVT